MRQSTDSDLSGAILIENTVSRVTKLEEENRKIAPVVSVIEAMSESINKSLDEIKSDVKDVKADVGVLRTSHDELKHRHDNRIRALEVIEEARKERKKLIIKTAVTAVGGLTVAILVWIFGLK